MCLEKQRIRLGERSLRREVLNKLSFFPVCCPQAPGNPAPGKPGDDVPCRKASLVHQINSLPSKHSFKHGNKGRCHVLENKINIEEEFHCKKLSMHHS